MIVNRVSIEFLTSSHLPADLTLVTKARLSGAVIALLTIPDSVLIADSTVGHL